MRLEVIDGQFSVCKVEDYSLVDAESPYCFTGCTADEKSLVCLTRDVPDNALMRDDGWTAFRIAGQLDFSLIGIIAGISGLLAEAEIGIFVISTYDTDYVLVRTENREKAVGVLSGAGYEITETE